MSYLNGPKIVTNGLVIALDAADTNSYVSGSLTWYDISGNNTNATLANGPIFSGSNGGTIVTDGSNDYMSITLPTFSSRYSISFWFKPITLPAISNTEIQLFESPADVASISLLNPSTTTYKIGSWNGSSYRQTNSIISLGTWCNFVMVNDTNTKLYLNGALDNTLANTATLNSGTARFATIGPTARFLNAYFGSIMFYNRGLNASEIQQNYNAIKSRFNLT